MTRVKICGITREADLRAAVDGGAHAVGFTARVTVDTAREISPDRAAGLVDAVPPFVTSVLVTMPETPADAIDLVDDVGPDAVQIHGVLSPEEIADVRRQVPAAVIAAVDANDRDAGRYATAADALLVDSVGENGGGGTGRTHDWDRTRALVEGLDVPVILAGGLTPGNVAEAVRAVEPFGVDVASGVEREGGVKDHDAIAAFVDRARGVPVSV